MPQVPNGTAREQSGVIHPYVPLETTYCREGCIMKISGMGREL